MNEKDDLKPTTSDEALVERTRSGDQRAFAELWRRHFRSGARVARQFTSSIDADDLVSEAYTRIYQRVLAGGGPTGAFRPYLYTTIRNLASTWGAASKDVQVDDIADFEDPDTLDDPAAIALDRTLTARAFRSLPERWQSVLWYTEVEGMDPHEVAPILGMSANGVAALSYRAREGLRKAWLQAHINDASASGECQWTISRMGDHARNGLGGRDSERMTFHLATCAKCSIISEEVDEVGSRLAFVMLPLLLGGVAGGGLLSSLGFGSSAAVASTVASTIPALPGAITAGTATATATSTGVGVFGAATAPVALVGTLVIAVAITGSVVVTAPQAPVSEDSYSVSQQETDGSAVPKTQAPLAADSDDESNVVASDDPANLGGATGELVPGVGGVVGGVGDTVGGVVGGVGQVVDSLVDTITDDTGSVASVSVSLGGSGTPGARVALQAAGQVYATTVVDANGRFSIAASAIPGGLASLDLVQTVDREYLRHLLPGGGVLEGVLGTLDGLINSLIVPLQLSNGSGGIAINVIG